MSNSTKRADVYQIVTDRIVNLLEQGTIPWRKPWRGGNAGHPRNLASGAKYRGVNIWLLHCQGYDSPYWITYKQAKARGGNVRKGEKSTPVVFWTWYDKKTSERGADGQPLIEKRPVLRYYSAFNVQQCEGLDYPEAPKPTDTLDFQPIEAAQQIIDNMPKLPKIEHHESRAYYRPATDSINLPKHERFTSVEEYYSTAFHELIHSTGHKSRLDRKGVAEIAAFSSATYSKEELIAEMGAAYLCGTSGIEQQTIDNSAAYIRGWLGRLRDDKRLVVTAAAAAQKASDFILNVTHE